MNIRHGRECNSEYNDDNFSAAQIYHRNSLQQLNAKLSFIPKTNWELIYHLPHI